MSNKVVSLLSTQIAEAMVASCQRACETNSIDDLLNRETMETIINQIKNDEGAHVQFIKPWYGFNPKKGAMQLITNEKIIGFINSHNLAKHLELSIICASNCNIAVLSSLINAFIDDHNYTDVINDTFEPKPKSGGRGRTRKPSHRRRRRRRATRRRH